MTTRAAAERRFLSRQLRAEGRGSAPTAAQPQPAGATGAKPATAAATSTAAADRRGAQRLAKAEALIATVLAQSVSLTLPSETKSADDAAAAPATATRLSPGEERQFLKSVRQQIRKGERGDGRLHLESQAPRDEHAEGDAIDALLTMLQLQNAACAGTLGAQKERLAALKQKVDTTMRIVQRVLPLMRESLVDSDGALAMPLAAVEALEAVSGGERGLLAEWVNQGANGGVAASRIYDAASHDAAVREMAELIAIAAEAESIDAEIYMEGGGEANAEAEEAQLVEIERLMLLKIGAIDAVLPKPSLAYESVAPGAETARVQRQREGREAETRDAERRAAAASAAAAAQAAAAAPRPQIETVPLFSDPLPPPRSPAPAPVRPTPRLAPGSGSLALLQAFDDEEEEEEEAAVAAAAVRMVARATRSQPMRSALEDIFEAHPTLEQGERERVAHAAAGGWSLSSRAPAVPEDSIPAYAAPVAVAPTSTSTTISTSTTPGRRAAKVHISRRGSVDVVRGDGSAVHVSHDGLRVERTAAPTPTPAPRQPQQMAVVPNPTLSTPTPPPRPPSTTLPPPRAATQWTDFDPDWRSAAPDAGVAAEEEFNEQLTFESIMPEEQEQELGVRGGGAASFSAQWGVDAVASAYKMRMPGTTRQKKLLGTCLRSVVEELILASTEAERIYISVDRPMLDVASVSRALQAAADVGIDMPASVLYQFSPEHSSAAAERFFTEAGVAVPATGERAVLTLDQLWWSLNRIAAKELFEKHDTNQDGLLAEHQIKPTVARLARMYGYLELHATPRLNRVDEEAIRVPDRAVMDFEELWSLYHRYLLERDGFRGPDLAAAAEAAEAEAEAAERGMRERGRDVSSRRSPSPERVQQVWGRLADASMPLASLSGLPAAPQELPPRAPPRPFFDTLSAAAETELPGNASTGAEAGASQLSGMPYRGVTLPPPSAASAGVHISRHGSIDIHQPTPYEAEFAWNGEEVVEEESDDEFEFAFAD